jgi:hypothetical protein
MSRFGLGGFCVKHTSRRGEAFGRKSKGWFKKSLSRCFDLALRKTVYPYFVVNPEPNFCNLQGSVALEFGFSLPSNDHFSGQVWNQFTFFKAIGFIGLGTGGADNLGPGRKQVNRIDGGVGGVVGRGSWRDWVSKRQLGPSFYGKQYTEVIVFNDAITTSRRLP